MSKLTKLFLLVLAIVLIAGLIYSYFSFKHREPELNFQDYIQQTYVYV